MRHLIVFMSALCLCLGCVSSHTVSLGEGSRLCVVVLPATPTPVETTASEELCHYWEKMGLPRPRVCHEGEVLPRGTFPVHIGWTARTRELTGLTPSMMQKDEFIVHLSANEAILAGHPTHGTLYAVDHLLEKYCGVRWWSAEEEFVQTRKQLELPELRERIRPAFSSRRTDGSQFAGNKSAALKVAWYNIHQKTNCKEIPAELGGADDADALCAFSHTAERFVPDEALFRSHRSWYGDDEEFPGSKTEFFALREGRRLGASEGQPCLTNPQVVEMAAANIIRLIARKAPQCRRIWLTQNDNTNYCECPNCQAAVKHLGNRADLNIQFVNQVGERVRHVYPNVELETFAYQYTLTPPQSVRPAPFVHVLVCLIEANAVQPLTHPDNAPLLEALKGWLKCCDKVNVWCYTTNFINYGLIHPVTRTLCADIPLFHRLGVKECFCEDGPEAGQFSWFAVWRGYLTAHLMMNPTLDADLLRRDYFNGYYGPAAAPLMKLMDLYEQEAADSGRSMTCFQLDTSHWLKPATLEKGEILLRQAEAAAPPDSEYAKRLLPIRASHDWTRLWRHENSVLTKVSGAQTTPRQSIVDLRAATLKKLQSIPRTPGWIGLYFKMGCLPLEKVLPTLDGYLAQEPEHKALPPELRGKNADDLVILPMARYSISEGEHGIHDYKSPTGEASRLRLNSWRWVARIDLPALPPCGQWEILLEARLPDAVKAPSGIAMKTGVYALGTNFAVKTEYSIHADQLTRDGYRLFSLGTTDFHRDGQIYFAGVANAAIPELLIGRVFLVRSN